MDPTNTNFLHFQSPGILVFINSVDLLTSKRCSDSNEANLSNFRILQRQSLQLFHSVADQLWKVHTILFDKKKKYDKQKETQLGLWERFYRKHEEPPSAPPPPPPPPSSTFLYRFWKTVEWEGILMTREVISSSSASVFSAFVTQPLEVLKIHYFSMVPKREGKFFTVGLGFFYEIQKIYNAHGISRFYMGHMAVQRESLFQTVSMFYTQQRVYQQLEEEGLANYPNLCSFISGFLSATIAVVALKPISKHREQRLTKRMLLKRHGPIKAAYNLKKPEYFSHLFRGCFPEFMFLGTQYGSRFLLYNVFRDYFLERKRQAEMNEEIQLNPTYADPDQHNKHLDYGESFIAGAASGILGDLVSHPLAVVNSRLQMGTLQRQYFCYKDTCRHYIQCIWLISKNSSIKGIYTGITPALLKSMICVALQFVVYYRMEEWLKSYKIFGV